MSGEIYDRRFPATFGRNVNPDTDKKESEFREQVRNILDLSHLSRDAQIYDELERLKEVERCYKIDQEEEVKAARAAAAQFRATGGK